MASWCPVVGSHFRRHFVKMKQVLNFKALFSFNCRMPTEEFRWKNEKVGSLQLHRCRTRNSLFPADAVWRVRWTERGSICWGCHQSSQPDTQILALTDLMWFHRFRNVYDGLRLIGLIWSYRSDLSLAFSWKSWTILLPAAQEIVRCERLRKQRDRIFHIKHNFDLTGEQPLRKQRLRVDRSSWQS